MTFRVPSLIYPLLFISFVFFTSSSSFKFSNYYFGESGFGYFDLLFCIVITPLALRTSYARKFSIHPLQLIILFLLLLGFFAEFYAVFANYKSDPSLQIYRRCYFTVIFFVMYFLVDGLDAKKVLSHSLMGIFISGCLYFYQDYQYSMEFTPLGTAGGLALLNDANIIGQIIALSAMALSLLFIIYKRYIFFVLLILAMFPAALSFSKATWLQMFLIIFGSSIVLFRSFTLRYKILSLVVIFCVILYSFGPLFEVVSRLIVLKVNQTNIGSANIRLDYLIHALYGSMNSVIFGHGSNNFNYVENIFGSLGLSDKDNAHNAFAELSFSNGILSTLLLFSWVITIALLVYKVLKSLIAGYEAFISALIVFSVIFLYANVQLQIYLQPFFYAFSGVILGVFHTVERHKNFQMRAKKNAVRPNFEAQ